MTKSPIRLDLPFFGATLSQGYVAQLVLIENH